MRRYNNLRQFKLSVSVEAGCTTASCRKVLNIYLLIVVIHSVYL